MGLTLLIGGVRSGKSAFAVRCGTEWEGPVTFLATAEARDEEMAEKIRRHIESRPAGWLTVEEPVELERRLGEANPGACVIVDCLTLWISNLIERGFDDNTIQQRAERAASIAASRDSRTIAITNEVGLGIIPSNPLARRFGDVLGNVNKTWATVADETLVMFAGKTLRL